MIVLRAELHSAKTGQITSLGTVIIENDGTQQDLSKGNYRIYVVRKSDVVKGLPLHRMKANSTRRSYLPNFPRKSYVIWRLVLRALQKAYSEDKP